MFVKKITVVFLFAFCGCVWGQEFREPQVRFDVAVQKEIKADGVAVNFSIEKKHSSLSGATREMQEVVAKLRKIGDEYKLSSADIQVQNTFMSSADWLFGKDYVVTSMVKVTLRNLDTWSAVAKRLTQVDQDMKFSGVSYVYPKSPEIFDRLLDQASKEALDRKAKYEQLFKVKLKMTYLRDMRIKPYEQTGGFAPKLRVMAAAQASSESEDMSTILPVQTYGVTLDVGYNIVN